MQLKRALRGKTRDIVLRLSGAMGPFRVEDLDGRILLGEEGAGTVRYPIESDGTEVGALFSGEAGADLAALIGHLYDREIAQRGLATETLGRYKELSLIYDLGETLANAASVEEVGEIVVQEAVTFLGASSVQIMLVDAHGDRLDPLTATADSKSQAIEDAPAIVRSVLETQRAQLAADDEHSMMCAPLRSGERLFGILVVANNDSPAHWTAGDLKLITSLAAKAADSITRATHHRAQLRDQALRGQVERFVSDALVECSGTAGTPVALLYCDLAQVTRGDDAPIDADAAMTRLETATAISLALLLAADATVNVGRGEMLVAAFAKGDFADCARAAVDAAQNLGDALDARNGGPSSQPLGLAVVGAKWHDVPEYFAAVGAAATLQAEAAGRVILDQTVAEHVAQRCTARPSHPDTYELLPL